MRAGVGASGTGQARVQWNAVIFVIPCVVDDVEFVSGVEEANWTSVITKVTAVSLVHFPFVAACHTAHQHEDDGTDSKARDEH